MHAAHRSSLMAGVALVGASVIAVTPVAPPPAETRSAEVRLAAASSLLNVPANLLIDVINIPHAEIQAIDLLARAQIFGGPWFVVSPTNLWGIDPGDPPRLRAGVGILAPFPALSGLYLDQNDQRGLGQQGWMLVAAELPVSGHCDVNSCMPTVPTSPITGITAVDSVLWNAAILTGQVKFPLFDNWFQIPLSDLADGFAFGPRNPDYPGYADPSGPVYPGLGIPGTTQDPETGKHLMPWVGQTFTLDLSKPFDNYFDHLLADPSTNPIQLPDLVEFGRTLQTLVAGMVIAFDPITPGSPFCPGDCSFLPAALDYPGIVKSIGDLWPGNGDIDEWLTAHENGTANVPTQEQIDRNVELIRRVREVWSFDNEPLPADGSRTGFNPSSLAPFFRKLWTDLGLNPPALAPAPTGPDQEPGDVDALTGGPVNELRAFEKVSQPPLPPSMTPNLITVNVDAAPGAPDSQVTTDVSTQAQQDVQSITRAATRARADAVAVPNNPDPKASQTPETDTTRDGNMAVPGKAGNGTKSRGGLQDALRSAGDQISSSISKLTGGLTGGTKTGETSTRDTEAGASGTGDTKAGEPGTGDTNARDTGGTSGRHRAESDSSDNTGDTGGTGGRQRAE